LCHTGVMGGFKKLSGIIGLMMICVAVANVELGALMPLEPPHKLILANMAQPGCSSGDIQTDLDSGSVNTCVSTLGVWDAADMLLILEGSILFFASFVRWPRRGRWAKRIRRIALVGGILLCGLAIADATDSLPGPDVGDLAALLPFPAPAIAVQIGVFMLGIFLIRGPKYIYDDPEKGKTTASQERTEKLHSDMDKAFKSGGTLKGLKSDRRMMKGMSRYTTVKDLWAHQDLSHHEDAFESGMRDVASYSLGRTCHLCNGAGCAHCSNTGSLQ